MFLTEGRIEFKYDRNKSNKIIRILNILHTFTNKQIYIKFMLNEDITDFMEISSMNYNHVYYDIFKQSLKFGNNVEIKFCDIISVDRFIKGNYERYTLTHTTPLTESTTIKTDRIIFEVISI